MKSSFLRHQAPSSAQGRAAELRGMQPPFSGTSWPLTNSLQTQELSAGSRATTSLFFNSCYLVSTTAGCCSLLEWISQPFARLKTELLSCCQGRKKPQGRVNICSSGTAKQIQEPGYPRKGIPSFSPFSLPYYLILFHGADMADV